jgi:hypothetical protein
MKSSDVVKKREADRYHELDQYLRRTRRLINEGQLDGPSVIRAVQSLEERLKARPPARRVLEERCTWSWDGVAEGTRAPTERD